MKLTAPHIRDTLTSNSFEFAVGLKVMDFCPLPAAPFSPLASAFRSPTGVSESMPSPETLINEAHLLFGIGWHWVFIETVKPFALICWGGFVHWKLYLVPMSKVAEVDCAL